MITLMQVLVVAGLILILIELLVGVEIDLVVIGLILIASGLVGDALSSFAVALVVSIVLSVGYIAFGRTSVHKKMILLTKKTNIDKLIGKTGIVVRSITPDTAGMVRLDDEDWRAISDELIYEKEKVKIEAIEGVSLKVNKIK